MSLDPKRFALNEIVNNNWTVTVETGTTLEQVLSPEFFANVAIQMRHYDHIRVRVDSGEWYAELLVLDCARVWVKAIKLVYIRLDEANDDAPAGDLDQFLVKYKGPHVNWCVIRKSDKAVIKDSCASEKDANAWLASHILAL